MFIKYVKALSEFIVFYFDKWAEECSSILTSNATICYNSLFISEDTYFDTLQLQAKIDQPISLKSFWWICCCESLSKR